MKERTDDKGTHVEKLLVNSRNGPSKPTFSTGFSDKCANCDEERKFYSRTHSSLNRSNCWDSLKSLKPYYSVHALQSVITHHDKTIGSDSRNVEILAPTSKSTTSRRVTTASVDNRKPFFYFVGMEHLLAGVSGGVASTLILHPLDLVKIRFAVSDGLSSRPQYNGLFHAFKSILKDEGVKGLYR